jgi:aryl-alcohol dehydrogenase-like predicted oxidoreductase
LEFAARAVAIRFPLVQPGFQGKNLAHNLALVDALRAIADKQRVTVAQVAIAWVLKRGKDIVPLVGARRERLHEALGALDVQLDAAGLERIGNAVPPGAAAGTRYAEVIMG